MRDETAQRLEMDPGVLASRERLEAVASRASDIVRILCDWGSEYDRTLMPGYTHLQHAQPTTLGHYLMRHYFTFENEEAGWESWPYGRPFHLILNIAVGGMWGGAKGIDDDALPFRMEVDYVRVYQERGHNN